jgi:hypothetical protein
MVDPRDAEHDSGRRVEFVLAGFRQDAPGSSPVRY